MRSCVDAHEPAAGVWDRLLAVLGLFAMLPWAAMFMFIPFGLEPGRCDAANDSCDVLIELGTLLLALLPWICIAVITAVVVIRIRARRPAWWLPVASVVAYFVVAIPTVVAIERVPGDAGNPPAGGGARADEPQPHDGATVFATFEEACGALTSTGGQLPRTTKREAVADRSAIAEELLAAGQEGIDTVGLSRCGPSWVVSVGVSDPSSALPRLGDNGTPVTAYMQSEFNALLP